MLEVIQFMFSSFWVWVGGLFYLAMIALIVGAFGESIGGIIKRGRE